MLHVNLLYIMGTNGICGYFAHIRSIYFKIICQLDILVQDNILDGNFISLDTHSGDLKEGQSVFFQAREKDLPTNVKDLITSK